MQVRWISESELLARATSGLISGILILGFAVAGWSIVPHAAATDYSRIYQDELPGLVALPDEVPVFVMRRDRSVIRHGSATSAPGDRLRVDIFRSVADEAPDATEALLFQPTLEVLWLVANEESQAELRRLLGALQEEGAGAIEAVIMSDIFNHTYRPMLRSLLSDAVSRAWEDEQTQDAFADLLRTSDTAMRQVLRGEIEAILTSRVKEALWATVQANWTNVIGVPFGYELDYAPVVSAVTAVLQDPLVHQKFVTFGRERLTTDEARRLAERLAIGLIDSLLRETRLPKVASEIMWDPRLRNILHPFSESAMNLVSALPRNLGGLGKDSSLNPLAAHIFKALVLGRHTPLVMFVTPQDRTRMEQLSPDAMRFLISGDGAKTT